MFEDGLEDPGEEDQSTIQSEDFPWASCSVKSCPTGGRERGQQTPLTGSL